jgi:hypothetical protein
MTQTERISKHKKHTIHHSKTLIQNFITEYFSLLSSLLKYKVNNLLIIVVLGLNGIRKNKIPKLNRKNNKNT